LSAPLGTVAATGPATAAGGEPSVFAGADVCRTTGLALLPGAVRPVYDDELWEFCGLADAPHQMTEREKRWDFSAIDNPRWRPVIKDLLLALLAPHDERVLAVPAAFRTVRSPRTCHLDLRRATTWCNWLTAHDVPTLGEVTQAHCDAFLEQHSWSHPETGQPRRLARTTTSNLAKVIQVLAPYGPLFLADRYRPGFVPWAGRTASQVTGRKANIENSTPPVPEHILQPLLANTLYLAETIGPHLAEEHGRLRASATEAGLSNAEHLGAARLARFEAAVEALRSHGAPLPRSSDGVVGQRLAAGWDPQDPLLRVHVNLIARQARIRRLPAHQLPQMRPVLEAAVAEVGVAGWWGRDAAVVPRADTGEPVAWTEPMTAEELRRAAGYVLIAAQILTTAATGMRRSELMEITAGSRLPAREVPGGGRRFRLASRVIKHQRFGGVPDEWVVIEQVDRAIALAERLTGAAPGQPLFGAVLIGTSYHNLRAWLSKPFARRLGLAALPGGPVNARMLRRTLALEMAKRPGGLLAAKIHLKHVSVATTEGYTQRPGGSQALFRAEVEHAEHQHHLELTVAAFRDYQQGILPTGPGARALIQRFDHIDAALQQPTSEPAVLANDRRLENLLRQQADVLHVGAANFCWFTDPTKALCLRLAAATEAKRPLLGMCDSARCPQATHHRQHRAIWADTADTISQFLGNPRVPPGEKRRLQHEHERAVRVLGEIDAATAPEAAPDDEPERHPR
jgi:integrase